MHGIYMNAGETEKTDLWKHFMQWILALWQSNIQKSYIKTSNLHCSIYAFPALEYPSEKILKKISTHLFTLLTICVI